LVNADKKKPRLKERENEAFTKVKQISGSVNAFALSKSLWYL